MVVFSSLFGASLKYFLFGSAASAIMLYGFSILYGLTGTLDFATADFVGRLLNNQSTLLIVAGFMALAGFLYKIAAAPMQNLNTTICCCCCLF